MKITLSKFNSKIESPFADIVQWRNPETKAKTLFWQRAGRGEDAIIHPIPIF